MKKLKIYPIKVGTEMWSRAYFNGPGAGDVPEEIPHIMFAIVGADKKVLVDTGGGVPGSPSQVKFHSAGYQRKPEEEPAAGLKLATGLSPEDIDIVILTHLHWDHCCNCHLFPRAQFYVQMAEVIDTINPIPRFTKTYESFSINTIPPWAQQPLYWNFLEGDHEIIPGISVVSMPGHSKGIQGVQVETEKGLYYIGSDSFPFYDNIIDGKVTPSQLGYNLEEAYHSCDKINKKNYAYIIPGHDALVLQHKYYPFD